MPGVDRCIGCCPAARRCRGAGARAWRNNANGTRRNRRYRRAALGEPAGGTGHRYRGLGRTAGHRRRHQCHVARQPGAIAVGHRPDGLHDGIHSRGRKLHAGRRYIRERRDLHRRRLHRAHHERAVRIRRCRLDTSARGPAGRPVRSQCDRGRDRHHDRETRAGR